METSLFSSIMEHYQWHLSLFVLIGVGLVTVIGNWLVVKHPDLKATQALNQEAAEKRRSRSYYMPIQNRSKFWGLLTMLFTFIFVLPFCLTLDANPWWRIPVDIFVILMVYDFFYYLTHRFLFHDSGSWSGPLKWVHAVHHQQKNPCRLDSNYLHPLETVIGIALYGATIAGLSVFMGGFHIATVIVTYVAFSAINQHNHDLMEVDRFPFKYLKYASDMHHVHHSRFTSGNYATISLLYDWLFGTYDTGNGYGKNKREEAAKSQEA